MRSLYWKIFISFWLASILIIFSITWIIGHTAQKSSRPALEQFFMDSYANAAAVVYESAGKPAFEQWLHTLGKTHLMELFLITDNGEVLNSDNVPEQVKKVADNLLAHPISEGLFKSGNLIISHHIITSSGKTYRLVALTAKPMQHLVSIPWKGFAIRVILAIFTSGLVCYLLSLYLTRPLRSLGLAAKSLATGKLNTRVGQLRGHHKDEIAQLSDEFDRMAEQLETLVLSKERLLQDISHELRSPLARLQIALELGRQKTKALAEAEFDRMELECSRLNYLIHEILDFARLDKEGTVLYLSKVDLADLIQQVADDANYEQKTSRVLVDHMDSCFISVDRRLIHRAIENVVRNALHYSPATEKVNISCYQDTNSNLIHIHIRDKGPGVPEDQLEKIFNAFYRVDCSREKSTGGYGLGLAISFKAIMLHDGKIIASNAPEGGLDVEIILKM